MYSSVTVASWLSFRLQACIYKVCISIRIHWICKKIQNLWVTYSPSRRFHHSRRIGVLHYDWLCAVRFGQLETMPSARERWSQENAGNYGDLSCTTVVGGEGGRSQIFLSPCVTYDLPSQFSRPQELVRILLKRDQMVAPAQFLWDTHFDLYSLSQGST